MCHNLERDFREEYSAEEKKKGGETGKGGFKKKKLNLNTYREKCAQTGVQGLCSQSGLYESGASTPVNCWHYVISRLL